jgi:hypothetical protein
VGHSSLAGLHEYSPPPPPTHTRLGGRARFYKHTSRLNVFNSARVQFRLEHCSLSAFYMRSRENRDPVTFWSSLTALKAYCLSEQALKTKFLQQYPSETNSSFSYKTEQCYVIWTIPRLQESTTVNILEHLSVVHTFISYLLKNGFNIMSIFSSTSRCSKRFVNCFSLKIYMHFTPHPCFVHAYCI